MATFTAKIVLSTVQFFQYAIIHGYRYQTFVHQCGSAERERNTVVPVRWMRVVRESLEAREQTHASDDNSGTIFPRRKCRGRRSSDRFSRSCPHLVDLAASELPMNRFIPASSTPSKARLARCLSNFPKLKSEALLLLSLGPIANHRAVPRQFPRGGFSSGVDRVAEAGARNATSVTYARIHIPLD